LCPFNQHHREGESSRSHEPILLAITDSTAGIGIESQPSIWEIPIMSASTSTRSNIGPLTTAFTYPSSCAIAVLDCQTCSDAWQAQACSTNAFNSQGVQDNPACWPPQSNDEYLTDKAFNGGGFYSPGVSCPTGYSAACSATYGGITEYSFQFPLVSSETAVGCCPRYV